MEAGLITQEKLNEVLTEHQKSEKSVGDILLDRNIVSEFDISSTVSIQRDIPYIHLKTATIDEKAIGTVSVELAKKYLCFPISVDKRQLSLSMVNPLDYECIEDIQFKTNFEIKAFISTREDILGAIERCYTRSESWARHDDENEPSLDSSIEQLPGELPEESLEDILVDNKTLEEEFEIEPTQTMGQIDPDEELKQESEKAPIVRLFKLIFTKGMKRRASDIHIDCHRYDLSVRFRVDGILQGKIVLPKSVQWALVSRVKVLASLDISERRLPQDGAIRTQYEGRDIDLRVATLPSLYGEKVVLRILDQSAAPSGMDALGLSEKDREKIEIFSKKRQGILLVTGPTGSGKSSTLYAFLSELRSEKINLMTVEDPVEYNMEAVNQIQVKPEIGLTFASALRSILRQDPNVILIGEIRDLETAEIAFRAAMTGHLVISTLHTNGAIETISRLLDIGIPKYLVSASLIGIIAQRLVRKICEDCKIEVSTSEDRRTSSSQSKESGRVTPVYQGTGCERCGQSGFYGRQGIFEVLPLSPKIRELISSEAENEEILKVAETEGFTLMGSDGAEKVNEGVTTLEEVLRVIEAGEEVQLLCSRCQEVVHPDFIACPKCKFDLQLNCKTCQKNLKDEWAICPYCKTENAEKPI